ncbi:MAG: alpha/beta fold hydrolase [Pseudomonadota bacterium]|nr:MAG: alpha/beta fold hydrolase [Pseudomonadota bacterium]
MVENQGIEIYFEDTGAGPPLVLGHSFLCSGTMWRQQLPALAGDYRVINPDLRGHGRSGHATAPFSLYDAVEDVVAVLDGLEIERAVWCGLSIGGMIALRAALTHPDRVGGLILMDTDAGRESVLRALKYRAMGLGVRAVGLGPFIPAVARLMFGSTTRRENPAIVDDWKAQVRSMHVPSALRGLEALLERDSLLERLEEIDVPALVVVGEEDRSLPPALSRQIHERLPGSTLRVIPRAGHLSSLERPQAVNAALLEFLGQHAGGESTART